MYLVVLIPNVEVRRGAYAFLTNWTYLYTCIALLYFMLYNACRTFTCKEAGYGLTCAHSLCKSQTTSRFHDFDLQKAIMDIIVLVATTSTGLDEKLLFIHLFFFVFFSHQHPFFHPLLTCIRQFSFYCAWLLLLLLLLLLLFHGMSCKCPMPGGK